VILVDEFAFRAGIRRIKMYFLSAFDNLFLVRRSNDGLYRRRLWYLVGSLIATKEDGDTKESRKCF
jgi:hypothetical protein